VRVCVCVSVCVCVYAIMFSRVCAYVWTSLKVMSEGVPSSPAAAAIGGDMLQTRYLERQSV
jgi:hypothetical protein